ncbi:MAG TPA: hypothetical protein VGI10_29335 [Polyangiaceae bacterium]
MSAALIASMHADILRVFSAPADEEWCVTWELCAEPTRWVQVTRAELNIPYLERQEPSALVSQARTFGVSLELLTWEPEEFATFSYLEQPNPDALAKLVLSLFLRSPGTTERELKLAATFAQLA